MLTAISPIDGRYASKTEVLTKYYSEAALIEYRIRVEIEYFLFLNTLGVISLNEDEVNSCRKLVNNFNITKAERVKEIENITNHDVKAVEYFIKENLKPYISADYLEFVHFGLTSQDINNTAMPLMIIESVREVIFPQLIRLKICLATMANEWKDIPMLAHTHGQPASPSSLGKELYVFVDRLDFQIQLLEEYQMQGKFGGATGNFNAHKIAYPAIDWPNMADNFLKKLGLNRQRWTTQIEHYDHLASLFQLLARINTILIDLSRDCWSYISMNYFRQRVNATEVGSSAMPHKVNPIDFENAEGNLSLANSTFEFLAAKLPISRLQRDLTDSTVTRNIGVPMAHSLIAYQGLEKGLSKLLLNKEAIHNDLTNEWAVISEAIQTILRREGVERPYELLKDFSRGKAKLSKQDFDSFIQSLPISSQVKIELTHITPHNYIGYTLS